MNKQTLKDRGFENVDLTQLKWVGYNLKTGETVILNKLGIARVYKCTGQEND